MLLGESKLYFQAWEDMIKKVFSHKNFFIKKAKVLNMPEVNQIKNLGQINGNKHMSVYYHIWYVSIFYMVIHK